MSNLLTAAFFKSQAKLQQSVLPTSVQVLSLNHQAQIYIFVTNDSWQYYPNCKDRAIRYNSNRATTTIVTRIKINDMTIKYNRPFKYDYRDKYQDDYRLQKLSLRLPLWRCATKTASLPIFAMWPTLFQTQILLL